MNNKPYQFYESPNSYAYTSTARDYAYSAAPKLPPIQPVEVPKKKTAPDKEAQQNAIAKAVARRMSLYIVICVMAGLLMLVSSVLYAGAVVEKQEKQDVLERIVNDNRRSQTVLAQKMAPEVITKRAKEELGMSYSTNQPIYISVKQGESLVVHK